MNKQTKAFTLVELIVVITILAILGTIAFISLQGYSKSARDSVRISDLKNIEKTLEIMITKTGIVPIPDDKVDITASGTVISYQGYAGAGVLQKINVYGGGKDPFDGEYYTYLTSKNLKKYQLMGFLENEGETTLLTTTFAKDYSSRFPIVRGNQLGILLASGSLVPIQKTGNGVDIVNTTSEFKAYLNNSNNEIISGTGVELARIGTKVQNFVSCKSIIDTYGYGISDGVYQINPAGTGSFDVYCDMTTDGGGWTRVGDNHLTNGDFENGEGILSEYGSNISNDIVEIDSPVRSGYAVHQTGPRSSEYEVHFDDISYAKKGYEIRLLARVTDSDGGIFHARQHYVDGSTKSNAPELGILLNSEEVGGKTWEYRRYRTSIDKDINTFNWFTGYAAEGEGITDLYFTGLRLELFYK